MTTEKKSMSQSVQQLLAMQLCISVLSGILPVLSFRTGDMDPTATLALLPFLLAGFLLYDALLAGLSVGIGKENLCACTHPAAALRPVHGERRSVTVLRIAFSAVAVLLLAFAVRQMLLADFSGAAFLLLRAAHAGTSFLLLAAACREADQTVFSDAADSEI